MCPGWKPLWVVDFPMFDYDEGEARWVACHHPFTSPKDEHMQYLETDPGKCLAKAYDMVLNGSEIGADSIVGAGAVVTQGKKFPDRSLIVGMPAKMVRKLEPLEVRSIKDNALRYAELADKHAKK